MLGGQQVEVVWANEIAWSLYGSHASTKSSAKQVDTNNVQTRSCAKGCRLRTSRRKKLHVCASTYLPGATAGPSCLLQEHSRSRQSAWCRTALQTQRWWHSQDSGLTGTHTCCSIRTTQQPRRCSTRAPHVMLQAHAAASRRPDAKGIPSSHADTGCSLGQMQVAPTASGRSAPRGSRKPWA